MTLFFHFIPTEGFGPHVVLVLTIPVFSQKHPLMSLYYAFIKIKLIILLVSLKEWKIRYLAVMGIDGSVGVMYNINDANL